MTIVFLQITPTIHSVPPVPGVLHVKGEGAALYFVLYHYFLAENSMIVSHLYLESVLLRETGSTQYLILLSLCTELHNIFSPVHGVGDAKVGGGVLCTLLLFL